MSIITIEPGSEIQSTTLNNNFEDLDGRITSANSSITTLQSNIQTLNSTLTAQINSSASSTKTDVLQTIYPVGSIYIGTQSTCPLSSLFGTWELVSAGKALWTSNGSNANTTIAAGLPNITAQWKPKYGWLQGATYSGAFTAVAADTGSGAGSATNLNYGISFNASRSSSVYGNSTTVQPPAYVVNVWRRTA